MLRFFQYYCIRPPFAYVYVRKRVARKIRSSQRFHGPTHGVDGALGPVVVRVVERDSELVGGVRQLGDVTKPVVDIGSLVSSGLKMSRVPIHFFLLVWLQPW
jgi:hypothetical protein